MAPRVSLPSALTSSRRRRLLAVVLALALVVTAAVGSGAVAVPAAGVADPGDWGTTTANRTEIVTTVWVDNPNRAGLTLGDAVTASYRLDLNGVTLADGRAERIALRRGNHTTTVSTALRTDRLADWWVAYLRANETIRVRAHPHVRVHVGPVDLGLPLPAYERTMQDNETPVLDAISATAASAEGRYSATGTGLGPAVEVQRGWAEWGAVTADETTVRLHFRIHNPNAVPIPAAPDHLGVNVATNGVDLLRADGEDARLLGSDDLIAPGETRTVTYAVTMDNDRVDDWFVSHVRRGERTTVETSLALTFDVGGTEVRVPGDSPVGYRCEIRTAILVDDQAAGTTCGTSGRRSA